MTAPSENLAPALTAARRRTRTAEALRDHLALARPGVLLLVLLTAPPVFALGRPAWPDAVTAFWVLLGTALVAGGASALNAWIERESDARMRRTRGRPLPAGRLSADQALRFGAAVSGLGLCVLLGVGGGLAALVGALTLFHYVVVYTLWLKPRTPQNIVIGGAAGAAAPLIADAALHGSIGIWGLVLFAIVFLWTPPHFWAIALYRQEEYAAAGFPMMPAVVGDRRTRRKMLVYALAVIPLSLLPWWLGELGAVYAATAALLGAWFVVCILRSMRARERREDRRVFFASIAYLWLLFAAMLVELLLH
ncbi:MAG: protoheme IX farnesyltransferase [Deltaproteobacteria bacterium]|nr:MAG: protoheme IX farnesyltransferase [Deltaproteobacteria bacterium]